MKDEIKEHMQNCIDREESCLLNSDNTKLLLDYIANLQEEIKSLKGSCKALGKKRENQRKELIVLSHNLSKKNVKVQTLKTNMKELQQENERLRAKKWQIKELKLEKDKEIERLNNIIKNLDKMFEYYFLDNLKYDQDTVNTIYIKYVKLKELKGSDK